MKALQLHRSQSGGGLLAGLVIVVVLTIVGLAGYAVVHNSTLETGSTGTKTSSTTVPTTLKTKADVSTAAKALDSVNVDSSINPDQLDSDLNSLL